MMPFHPVKPIRGGKPLDAYFQRLASHSDWVCQAKMDGQRTLWVPDSPAPGGGRGVLWSRRELMITRAPAVRQALQGVDVVIDGELILAGDPIFYPFDLPDHKGTLDERWKDLADVVERVDSPCVRLCPTEVAWSDVMSYGWEGVVFKRRISRYVKGSTPDKTTANWIKYRAEWL